MSNKRKLLLVGFVLGAILYWLNPYDGYTILGVNQFRLMGIVGALSGSLACIRFRKSDVFAITSRLYYGYILAVGLRIVADMLFLESASHNLLPLELIWVSVLFFFPATFAGFLTRFVLGMVKGH